MAAAGRVQRASLQTIGNIEPAAMATELQDLVREGSMVPGVVTVLTAESIGGEAAAEAAMDRAVGIQLSYDGLRLTRELIRGEERYRTDSAAEGYLPLVGAEVLVSRGFSNLVHTDVAGQAIDIVQRFSRKQTLEYDAPEAAASERTLEHDVIVLGVEAGATVVHDRVPDPIRNFGAELAESLDAEPLPPAAEVTPRIRRELGRGVAASDTVTAND